MDKRKVIILAIVLFLIIGLGTFVFAGGSEENEGQGNNTIDTPDNGGNDGQDTPDGTIDDGENEGEGGQTGTVGATNNNGNTTGGTQLGENEDDNTPGEPSVDNTKADLLAALQAIQEKIDSAKDEKDIDNARSDRTEELINQVKDLNDEELNSLLEEINRVLNDEKSPVIMPEDLDGSYNNSSVAVTISDDTETNYVISMVNSNGEEVEVTEDLNNLSLEGTYTLTVVDEAFNETSVTFTIDKTAPVITINGKVIEATDETLYFNSNATITVEENNLESFTSNGNDRTENVLAGSWTAGNDGVYKIVVTDKAGNTNTYNIVVDKTKPVINLYADNGDELVSGVTTIKEVKVLINEANDYSAVLTQDGKDVEFVEDAFYGRGNYVLTVTDVAGNEATATFNVDKNPPAIYVNGKKYDKNTDLGYINEDVTLKLLETNLDSVKLTKNGNEVAFDTELTLTDDGKYEITATDLAGSKVTVKFIIDSTSAEVTVDYDKETPVRELKVTISFNEAIDETTLPQGYYPVDGKENTYNKVYYSNEEHEFVVKDLAGNETTVKFEITNIDRTNPTYNYLSFRVDGDAASGVDTYYANEFDTLYISIAASEELSDDFKFVITDSEGNTFETSNTKAVWINDRKEYVYQAYVNIPENLVDGKLTATVKNVFDLAGNEADKTLKSDKVVLDTTVPTVKFPATHNYNKYYSYEYLTVTITEENLDEVYYTWANTNKYVDAKTLIDVKNIVDNNDGTYTVKIPTIEGRNKLNIKAVDKSGNVTKVYSAGGAYNIDKTNPEITLYKWMSDGNHQVVEPSAHNYCVLADATDANLASITLNGKTYTNKELICDNGTYELVATDKAGLTKTINFEIDREYGSVIINGTDEYNTYDLDTVHKYNKIDSITFSEEGAVRLSLNDEVIYFGSTEEFKYTFVDGVYKVELFDKAGNPTVVKFELDSVAPQVVELRINSSNTNKNYANETHTVGIYLTVDEKLAKDPVFTIDGVKYQKNQGNEEKNFYAVVTKLPESTTEGEIKFTIEVEDEFGNVTTFTNADIKTDTSYDYVIFDTTEPTININNWKDLTLEVGSTYEDEGATALDNIDGDVTDKITTRYVYYDKDGNKLTPAPTEIVLNEVGQFVITYVVTDNAGNKEELNRRIYVVDTTPPVIEGLENNGVYFDEVTFKITDNSGRYTMYYGPDLNTGDFRDKWNKTVVDNDELMNHYANGETFTTPIAGWDLCVEDNSGNYTCIKNITIKKSVASAVIDGETINFASYTDLFSTIPDNKETNITINNDTNEDIIIPENKIVSIDLNNNTISGNKVITNNGTIKSISNGTIESTNNGIINNGTIELINNVKFDVYRTGVNNKGNIIEIVNCDIEANYYPIYLSGTAIINKLESNTITGHYMDGIYVADESIIGEIVSGSYISDGINPDYGQVAGFGLYISTNAKVELISGGTFKGSKAAVANYGTIVNITGGNFEEKYTGNAWDPSTTILYDGSIQNISGGQFFSYGDQNEIIDSRIDFNLADGYEFVKVTDNYYKVQAKN